MSNDLYIAIDLGGTNIRTALFQSGDVKILKRIQVPTDADRGINPVIETICQSVRDVMPADPSPVRAIGIGIPGPLDPHQGIVIQAPNLPGWKNIPAREMLEKCLNLPVAIGNDANLAGLAEWKFGAGKNTRDLVYYTISTGIGGGVISGGRMLVGSHGLAAELGHVMVDPDGPPCSCGGRGHLEAVAAGPAIARRAVELLQAGNESLLKKEYSAGGASRITAELVSMAGQQGDSLAKTIFNEVGTHIGHAIADMLVVFNPGVVVLGGGVSKAGELLLNPVRKAVEKFVMNSSYLEDLQIVTAKLGGDVGLYGAFALAIEEGLSGSS